MCALKKKSYTLTSENKCLPTNRDTETFRKNEPYCQDSSDDEDAVARNRGLSTIISPLYDMFIYSVDCDPDIINTLRLLLQKHHHLVCDQNNFVPGETYLDNFGNLMEKSKRLILVVSKRFLGCNLSLFFIKMAVEYHTSKPDYKIITLLVGMDKTSIPLELRCFEMVSMKEQKAWCSQLLHIIETKCENKNNSICPSTGHVEANYFTGYTDTTMSDPLPFTDISPELKSKNKILFKKMLANNPKLDEDMEILYSVVKSVKVGYDQNMEFFYHLKSKNRPVFEAVKDYKTEKIRLDKGDILDVVVMHHNKKCSIKNAIGRLGEVPHSVVMPILTDFPSIMVNKLSLPITKDKNLEFQKALEEHGFRVVRAAGRDFGSYNMFLADCGDILCLLEENGDKVRVRNCKGLVGWVTKSDIMDVETTQMKF